MKIGIVNDLPIALEALRRTVSQRPDHQILWMAHDGEEAVARCARATPDLVLMDLIMPGIGGVEATRRIMANSPCAVLIVTASVDAQASRVFEAMGYGALDAIDTPDFGSGSPQQAGAALLARIDIIGKLIGDRDGGVAPVRLAAHGASAASRNLIAIGASAGGPAALARVLSLLPKQLAAGIVIVQHVDPQFAVGMADWLSGTASFPVRVAGEGDRLADGCALLAATADHLVLKQADRLGYVREPQEAIYRPSIDVFFNSVARLWSGNAVGVLLTGMGRDGAAGLKSLREQGYHTIAQDKDSCAVYGMPKAAAAIGAAVEMLTLDRIAQRLIQLVPGRVGQTGQGGQS
jgi:chemotaxis response regulator CheB